MLTAMGLNVASVAPPISRRRELPFSTRDRPCPGCPRVPQGAPGSLREPQGAADPREQIRALPRARKPRGEQGVGSGCEHGRQAKC